MIDKERCLRDNLTTQWDLALHERSELPFQCKKTLQSNWSHSDLDLASFGLVRLHPNFKIILYFMKSHCVFHYKANYCKVWISSGLLSPPPCPPLANPTKQFLTVAFAEFNQEFYIAIMNSWFNAYTEIFATQYSYNIFLGVDPEAS